MTGSGPLRDPRAEAWAGVRMTNPASGESIVVEDIGRGSRGSFARGRLRVAPGGSGPPLPVHPNPSERFEVEAGEFTVHLDGEKRELSAGEAVVVPEGTPHGFENESGEPSAPEVSGGAGRQGVERGSDGTGGVRVSPPSRRPRDRRPPAPGLSGPGPA
jgi:mannose-6-phosphate isomerase-like protein (cupin superfamily)